MLIFYTPFKDKLTIKCHNKSHPKKLTFELPMAKSDSSSEANNILAEYIQPGESLSKNRNRILERAYIGEFRRLLDFEAAVPEEEKRRTSDALYFSRPKLADVYPESTFDFKKSPLCVSVASEHDYKPSNSGNASSAQARRMNGWANKMWEERDRADSVIRVEHWNKVLGHAGFDMGTTLVESPGRGTVKIQFATPASVEEHIVNLTLLRKAGEMIKDVYKHSVETAVERKQIDNYVDNLGNNDGLSRKQLNFPRVREFNPDNSWMQNAPEAHGYVYEYSHHKDKSLPDYVDREALKSFDGMVDNVHRNYSDREDALRGKYGSDNSGSPDGSDGSPKKPSRGR